MTQEALNIAYSFLCNHYKYIDDLKNDLINLAGINEFSFAEIEKYKNYSYDEIQDILSKLNEKESIRKSKGVYYTPTDVVEFILKCSIKSCFGKLKPDTISDFSFQGIPYRAFATKTTIFDPTCGAGEYLLKALEYKLELLKQHNCAFSSKAIKTVAETIWGNDINKESTTIAKLRLFICFVEKTSAAKCVGLSDRLNACFFEKDFVSSMPDISMKYDVIIGNPPYVEDSKSGLDLSEKYGNIYANVLKHSSLLLSNKGVLGFIIPLSYVATPRMKKIRKELFRILPEQYILNYADRPDCLFDSVHQKLSILIAKKRSSTKRVYTGNYQYWYKEERRNLFEETKVIKNSYMSDDYIPKLGTKFDVSIYEKINGVNMSSVYAVSRIGNESVYLNRRETFWMKAYRTKVNDPEYKIFSFATAEEADYCYCLIHSSLFWWYWICTSDCWHVSKELNGFKAPTEVDMNRASQLARNLERRLEETKVFVGTKQTEYEYKHRDCIEEIHAIDNFVNAIFGLTFEESEYIKNFAFRYRVSGGAVQNGSD